MNMNINSVKFRFTAGVFFLIVMITVLFSILSYENEKRIIEERTYAQLAATADMKKWVVADYINERTNDLRTSVSDPELINNILSLAKAPINVQSEHSREYLYVYNRFKSFQDVYAECMSLEATDLKGNVIVSTEAGNVNSKLRYVHEHKQRITKYIDSIKRGDAAVMQDYLSTADKHIDIAIGIRDRDRNLRAILVSSILLETKLFPVFRDYTGLGNTGEAFLVRASGDRIVHLTPMRFQHSEWVHGSGHAGEKYKLELSAATGKEGIDEEIDYRNKRVIGAYRYIPLLKWGVVAKIDADEAFGEMIALRKKIFAFVASTFIVMLTATYIVVSRFTKPIDRLTGKTKAVAAGDYTIRIESVRKDEIGVLEKNFNDMVGTLDNSRREIKNKQDELEKINDELERKVIERTNKLSEVNKALLQALYDIKKETEEKMALEEQLRQSQKMEAIGQLAGGIAHDFNNILTAIMGFSYILKTKIKGDDHLIFYVDEILNSSERAAKLTQSLLAFSRKQLISLAPVSLNEIVSNLEKLLLRIIGEDIELRVILAKQDLTVMADSSQIEQVLMNLVTNARDAMPDGGHLTIETRYVELDREFFRVQGYGEQGSYALISVTDTGTGIDEKAHGKVFEPFFTTKEIGKGTGLGLSIVYGIVKQLNGYVNFYSEPGRGTTFRIYIPLIKPDIRRTESEALLSPEGGSETILIGEDDMMVRKLVRAVLEDSGYSVIEAVDGEDAVNKFIDNKDRVRFVILDVIMPRKNGKAAYDEIRDIQPDIKALFISGYTADIIDRKGIIEDGLNFISKPVSPNELLRKIREILDE